MAFIFNPFNPVNPFFYFTHRAEAINPLGRRPSTKTQTKKKEEKSTEILHHLKHSVTQGVWYTWRNPFPPPLNLDL